MGKLKYKTKTQKLPGNVTSSLAAANKLLAQVQHFGFEWYVVLASAEGHVEVRGSDKGLNFLLGADDVQERFIKYCTQNDKLPERTSTSEVLHERDETDVKHGKSEEEEEAQSDIISSNDCHGTSVQNLRIATQGRSGRTLVTKATKRTEKVCSSSQTKCDQSENVKQPNKIKQVIDSEKQGSVQPHDDRSCATQDEKQPKNHEYLISKKKNDNLRLQKEKNCTQDITDVCPSEVRKSAENEKSSQQFSSSTSSLPHTFSDSDINCTEMIKVEAEGISTHGHVSENDCYESYKCELCGWVFCKNSYSKGSYLQPSILARVNISERNIIDHVKTIHRRTEHSTEKKSVIICTVCGLEFSESDVLLEHIVYDHSMQFTCKECNKNIIAYSDIHKHFEAHKTENREKKLKRRSVNSNQDLKCLECGIKVLTKYNLQRHMRRRHQERKFTCKVCKKKFVEKPQLEKHLKTHNMKIECDIEGCYRKFSTEANLLAHKAKHGSIKAVCTICGKTFPNMSKLNYHMTYHSDERNLECPECGKAYKTKDVLSKHMRIHKSTRHYYCEICGRGFDQSGSLQRHMLVHTDSKPYKCNECGVQYRNIASLKTHKLRTGHYDQEEKKTVRTIDCKECGKQFLTCSGHEYKRHLLTHTGEKPFTCTICNKSFNDRSNLKHHIKIHEDDRPFSCNICEKRFIHQRSLKKHMINHSQIKSRENVPKVTVDKSNTQIIRQADNPPKESESSVSKFDILSAAASHIDKWARETGADQFEEQCEPTEISSEVSLVNMQKPADQNCEIVINADARGNIFITNTPFMSEDSVSEEMYINKSSTSASQFEATEYNSSNIQVICSASVMEKWPISAPALTNVLQQPDDRYINMEPGTSVPLLTASTSGDNEISLKQYSGPAL